MITTRNKWVPYLFLLPGVLLFLAVGVYSVGFSIMLSFYNWSGIDFSTARFEGLANFRQFLLGDDPIVTQNFYNSLLHNVLIGAAQVVIVIPIAIVLAFVLQNTKMASLYRTVYFLPMIASGVAIFYVWKGLFEPTGAFNSLFHAIGLDFLTVPGGMLGSSSTSLIGIIITSIWGGLPGTLILYYAGLTSIDPTLYEAADVDGASKLTMITKITWPLLKPITLIAVIQMVNGAFQAFENVFIMTGGGPSGSSEVIGTLVYRTAFLNNDYGLASAIGWVSFLITGAIAMFSIRSFKVDI
ncbi:multiple sugar transport system permease protein/raffinose/stachyose/melibiose transport system permease protein [Paenibacillus rhizosphaerae]|uniref:Multiple sugar transport system permease protein/raffinose/stachyose/melibiose transport system permease protein n=1 Tax=Paenibacillus rhizosphaerae TaxID=297318 RepID=A0A839U0A1_9BACL|nr:sugar ABC transporter permease [Paenibacillus rhizosphaerae]MBB3130317.1 multiple sugar transport system permease protein/raffinose/stachyose/melibiose transport system permease protein [Paenibacillus rhizosphaerae]